MRVQLLFNLDTLSVTLSGVMVELLPKEYALLEYLYRHHGRTFTRQALLDAVWPLEAPVDRTVDDHIYRLRKKLKRWDSQLTIDTVRGRGYRLSVKEQPGTDERLLQDPELSQQISSIYSKYHAYGHGEAIRMLAANQHTFGVALNRDQALYVRVIAGEMRWLVETTEYPFWEKAFYLLHLYHYIHFDIHPTIDYFERAYAKHKLPRAAQTELVMNLIGLYLEAGDLQRAQSQLNTARILIEEKKLDGFRPFFMLHEIMLAFLSGDLAEMEHRIAELEALLARLPYSRELGTLQVTKGLLQLQQTSGRDGALLLEEGLETLRRTRFMPHYLYALRLIIMFMKRYVHVPGLQQQYEKLWQEIAREQEFDKIKLLLEREFAKHL